MLVSEIISSVKARLRQRGSTSTFSSQAIIDYANEILLEISDELQFTRKLVSIQPDSNSRVYLPADCLTIEYVGHNGIEILPLTPAEMALTTPSLTDGLGGWFGYQFVNGYIQLSQNADAISLQYIAALPKIDNENQDIDVREEYRRPIIDGVTHLCFLELGVMDKAAYFEQSYRRQLAQRRETIRKSAFKTRKVASIPPVEL